MAERLTMKVLSSELDTLRKSMRKLETDFERKLESAMEKAAEKLKSRIEESEGLGTGLHIHAGAGVDVNARRRLIEERAYFMAERRGFTCGSPEQDWLEAEREIDNLLLHGWTKTASNEPVGREHVPREESRP